MKRFQQLAIFTFSITMLLVTWGGVVHNTGSSLACPDWPLCFGQIMPKMEGIVAIEHSHRLLGALVGICSIGLVFLALRIKDKAPNLLKYSVITLLVVIFQGVLGGVTVLLRLSPLVSTAHLATSQVVIALLFYLSYAPSISQTKSLPQTPAPEVKRILKGLKWAAITLYIQMCLGAFIRHGGQSTACGLGWDSAFVCRDGINPLGTFFPATLEANVHMLHRLMAGVTVLAIAFGTRPFLHWARREKQTTVRLMIVASHILISLQILLGIYTIASGISFGMVTAHLVTGMLAWINIFAQNLVARRLLNVSAMQTVQRSSQLMEQGV